MPSTAPFGTWKSPIGADLITQQTISIVEVHVDPITADVYHVEGRPSEGGRNVLVHTRTGKDVFGKEWNVRTRVQEYGGAAVAIRGGVIYFTDFKTNRLYTVGENRDVRPVSPDNPKHRFGDFVLHPTHSDILVSILEDHTGDPPPSGVVTTLVVLNTKTQKMTTIAKGADFYSTPRFSPDGKRLSWIFWNHPNMPWDDSQLAVAGFSTNGDSVEVTEPDMVGNLKGEKKSVNQAKWASDTTLVFLSDEDGFYNPWKYDAETKYTNPILHSPIDEEYADPAWFLGASRYSVMESTTLLVAPMAHSLTYLALFDVNTGTLSRIPSPFVSIDHVHAINSNQAVFVASKDDAAAALVLMTLPIAASVVSEKVDAEFVILKETSSLASQIKPGYQPFHQAKTFTPGGKPLHVLYYPPTSADYSGGKGDELPPCIVNMHGGPTSHVPPGLVWTRTYFTSRGWAWVDVNYGGSSGYGREYRNRLLGNWGLVDVEDSVTAIEELGKTGLIDIKRCAIRGGSAGGFSVLAAAVTKPVAFAAATSSYGVSDLVILARDTHKFESRYLDGLLGGTIDEVPKVYEERSPVNHAENIKTPLLILQGSEDPVVPPNQSQRIVDAIEKNGGKVKYILFEGEGHGFRKAENIKQALESEEAWYREVFGFGQA